jgi:hypothetical protein
MKNVIIIFLTFQLGLISQTVFGQKKEDNKSTSGAGYNTGIGVRLGYYPGISLKHFTNSSTALEGIAHFRNSGFVLTGLFEKHQQAFEVERLNWFYGAGLHAGLYRQWGYYKKGYYGYKYDDPSFMFGIDGILGLEYVIEEIPFTVGFDIKPFIDLIHPGFNFWDGAFTIRYRF